MSPAEFNRQTGLISEFRECLSPDPRARMFVIAGALQIGRKNGLGEDRLQKEAKSRRA